MEIPKEGLEALADQAEPTLKDTPDPFRYQVRNIGIRIDIYSLDHEGPTLSVVERIVSRQPMVRLPDEPRAAIIRTLEALIAKLDDPQVWNELMEPGLLKRPRVLGVDVVGLDKNGRETDLLNTLTTEQCEAVVNVVTPGLEPTPQPTATQQMTASDLADELLGR